MCGTQKCLHGRQECVTDKASLLQLCMKKHKYKMCNFIKVIFLIKLNFVIVYKAYFENSTVIIHYSSGKLNLLKYLRSIRQQISIYMQHFFSSNVNKGLVVRQIMFQWGECVGMSSSSPAN